MVDFERLLGALATALDSVRDAPEQDRDALAFRFGLESLEREARRLQSLHASQARGQAAARRKPRA